LQQ
ncbi:hypothetical protein D030_3826B, partial [Vibrio parahaemolyticus AQ3810]|jgi:hypothetical protein